MKLGFRQVQLCIALISLAIIIGQGAWIYNMYASYYHQFAEVKESAIEAAIIKEHNIRYERLGGTIVSIPLTNPFDTARYITKTVQLQDTSFEVTQDRLDPYSEMKLSQFILKDHHPINIGILDSLFRAELVSAGFSSAATYVEYRDVKAHMVLDRFPDTDVQGYLPTELKIVDIFNTIGIKAYADIPALAILKRMTFQLILSAVLMAICIVLLSAVVRTFFWRERVELMRQESVNAMTHEFKRPISSAMAQAALIPHQLQKGRTDKVEQYAGNVVLELEKLTAYTHRVQRLSNNKSEHIPLNKEYIVLKDFLTAIVEKYNDTREKEVQLALSQMTNHDIINVDKVHFANIMENLIENAIKYSKKAVSILINISESDDGLKIAIKDDGLGIPNKDIPYIFDRFYRSEHRDVQQQAGFGLGLTYVKATVEAHGGAIHVTSELGTGSEFTLYFPIDDA